MRYIRGGAEFDLDFQVLIQLTRLRLRLQDDIGQKGKVGQGKARIA